MLGYPISTQPISVLPPGLVVVTTQESTVRFASEGFVTRASDVPANTYIPGRIAAGLRLSRELTGADEGQFGSLIEARFGEIILNNSDGALDSLIGEWFSDGREIRLMIGAKEVVSADRSMPRYIATGDGISSGDASVPYVMEYPAGLIAGDLFVAQITINDRGAAPALSSVPTGWLALSQETSGPLHQALLYRFVTDDWPANEIAFSDEFGSLSLDTGLDGGETWAWRFVAWNTSLLTGNGDEAFKAWSGYNPGGGGQTPAAMGVVLHEASGGTLKLYGRQNPNTTGYGVPYLAGMINSELSQSHLYGTWEVRARFTVSKGHHWAIWMVATGDDGTGLLEIDIAQFTNDTTEFSVNRIFMNSWGANLRLLETWTGSNGSAWPTSQWGTPIIETAGAVDIQTNQGRLQASGATYTKSKILSTFGEFEDFDLTVQVTLGDTGEQYHFLTFLTDGVWSSTLTDQPDNGYALMVIPSGIVLFRYISSTRTELGDFSPGALGTTAWNIRLNVRDGLIRAKIWQGTEPHNVWGIQVTDSNRSSGIFGFSTSNGNATTARSVRWDTLTALSLPPAQIMHGGATPASEETNLGAFVQLESEEEWQDWHIFKFVWTPSTMEWWLDDIKRMSCDNYIVDPMHLMISPEIGGLWEGDPDGTTVWPTTAEIDYITFSAARLSVEWESADATNDCIVGRVHQYRYVDPDQPWELGETQLVLGDLDSIGLPSLDTFERNSFATYWASWSDNVTTLGPSGQTGGDWNNLGDIESTSVADDAANRRGGAQMVEPGTISGGSIQTTPTDSPVSEVSLLVGAVLRGIPSAGGLERVQAYEQFETVYTAIAGHWSFGEQTTVRLRIQTLAAKLQNRLQQLTYAGSGSSNGTADLTGRTRPLCFGHCLNVSAQLVDPSLLIFQVHSGSIESIDAVYDRAVSVPFVGSPGGQDYPTYAALAAASVAPGFFSTCLAEGYFKIGAGADPGSVTADVKGDEEGGYVDTHALIIRRMLLAYSPLVSADLDGESFIEFDEDQPAEIGIFFPAGDQTTVEEAIAQVAFAGGALAGQDRSGLYRVQQLTVPATAQHWTFTDRDITDIERMPLPYGVPWKAWEVAYERNWTIQTGSDIADGVSQSRRQFLEAEARYVSETNAAISLAHATSAGAPSRRTLFHVKADAEAESLRLLEFYALGRALYRVTVKTALFSVEIGQTVRLIYPRWNLSGGRNHVVIAILDDADRRTTEMLLFG